MAARRYDVKVEIYIDIFIKWAGVFYRELNLDLRLGFLSLVEGSPSRNRTRHPLIHRQSR